MLSVIGMPLTPLLPCAALKRVLIQSIEHHNEACRRGDMRIGRIDPRRAVEQFNTKHPVVLSCCLISACRLLYLLNRFNIIGLSIVLQYKATHTPITIDIEYIRSKGFRFPLRISLLDDPRSTGTHSRW